jgi:hypothetical protein
MSIFGGHKQPAAAVPKAALGIDFTGSQYGVCIPVILGRNKVAGTCIWYGDFKAIPIVTKTQSGKGGGSHYSVTGYNYSASFELGLCAGVATVNAVYDGTSVVSLASLSGVDFSGTAGQAPWGHLSGAAALGYSGTGLVAFQDLPLGQSPSLPNYNFEMDGPCQLGGGVYDCDPADIITYVCTNALEGMNFNALGSLTQLSNYARAAGLLFSPVYDTQQSGLQTLDELIKYSNTAAWFSEGVLKFQPYGDRTITGNSRTYNPPAATGINLGPADFITNGPGPAVKIKRKSAADAVNIVRVQYKDRANTYHDDGVVASIDQDVLTLGQRADATDSTSMITSGTVAQLVAQNLLQRQFYVRNTYEFQLSWRYCDLECMDIVTLTDANTGLNLTPVRIIEVDEDAHGLLSFIAEEYPEGIGHGNSYANQPNGATAVDRLTDPGPIAAPYIFRGPGFLVSPNAPEIWCAIIGLSDWWAGCDVFMSQNGSSYTYLTTYARRAAYGVLTNTLGNVADPDTTSAPNVSLNGTAQLLGGSASDCDEFVTLAMVDTEIISYQVATLAAGPSYTLGTRIRRGGYGSAIASHSAGAPFVRLDENILRIPVDPSQIGKTIYLKFLSFNVFGLGGRTLAGETPYTYVVGTNVECPDVPQTPGAFAVIPVADGNNMTWQNVNPAAVGCTSIEISANGSTGWTVIAQCGPTATSFHHAFTSNTLWYYRARSRGSVIAGGWSAYTAVYNSQGRYVSGIIVPGSGVQIGDERNLPQITVTNFNSKLPAVITYSAAAGTPATATISVAAFTVLAGSVSINYNAMSAGTTGTNGTTVTYYLYMDDALYAGGSHTLVATTNANDVYGADGRAYIGAVVVVYPNAGSGSGGGSNDRCVCDGMLIGPGLYAADALPGDVFDCMNLAVDGMAVFPRELQAIERARAACVRITTDAGAVLDCSACTPFDLLTGRSELAENMLGHNVITDRGVETVVSVEPLGERSVYHIHLGGVSFAAGKDATHRIYSHNLKP